MTHIINFTHQSGATRSYLVMCNKYLDTETESKPDLNPSEHLWEISERHVRQHSHQNDGIYFGRVHRLEFMPRCCFGSL